MSKKSDAPEIAPEAAETPAPKAWSHPEGRILGVQYEALEGEPPQKRVRDFGGYTDERGYYSLEQWKKECRITKEQHQGATLVTLHGRFARFQTSWSYLLPDDGPRDESGAPLYPCDAATMTDEALKDLVLAEHVVGRRAGITIVRGK